MSHLIKELVKFQEDPELLKLFRNAVENEVYVYLNELNEIEKDIMNDKYDDEMSSHLTPQQRLTQHQIESRSYPNEILPFLNELNLSIKDLPLYSFEEVDKDGNFEGTENLYDIKDIIHLINKMDDYLYFVSMVYIQQNIKDYQHQMYAVSIRVSGVLSQLRIRLPRYGRTAFIAMSFNPELEEIRKVISDVVSWQGFKPIIIDSKEHNNQIFPEIFYEIQNAEFVIADLTDHRNGVYYEAGYAKGLGKEVIFTCKMDDFDNRHFDVAQTNTIVWSEPYKLREKLSARIESTFINE